MSNYIIPQGWKTIQSSIDSGLENYEELLKEFTDVDKINLETYNQKSANLVSVVNNLISLTPSQTNLHKYLKNSVRHPGYPVNYVNQLKNTKKNFDGIKQKTADENRLAKQKLELEEKKDRAILFLIEKGYLLGKDFTSLNAIEYSNEIVFKELIEKKIEQLKNSDDLLEFSGMNCDSCSGWNGQDRRCNCGNRRVCWDYTGDFENMYIYGEAW